MVTVTLQDRVTRYLTHGITFGFLCRLSIFGLVLVVIGSRLDGNFEPVVAVGWVLFSLPYLCFGLVVIIPIGYVILLGIGAIARGMRFGSLVEAVKGMIITTQSSILLVAIFDIALNASDNMGVVLSLPVSVFVVVYMMAVVFRIVRAVTLACIKRWGMILQAKVHQRRRRPRKDGNGMDTYEHQLLVTFDVETSHPHQPSWRRFGYQMMSFSNTEASSVDEEDLMEMESVVCEESNEGLSLLHSHILDEGCPVQPGLVQEKTDDNAIPYTRQSIREWLTVNESQYESSNNFVEVSALPSWPQISVATETLPSYCHSLYEVIAFTSLAAVVPVVFGSKAREDIFDDDNILWHVKASYVLVSILLPSLPLLLFMFESAPLEAEESGSHVPNEISPELPMVEQSTRGSR